MPYPFGLHRLPAPAPPAPQHWTRERLDTPRQHQSGRSTSPKAETDGERHGDSTNGRAAQRSSPEADTPEEPEPARQQQRRQDRQQTTSTTRAAEIEPEPEEPEARHCRPRETDGDRKTKREEKKRGNEEKTTVKRRFSPRLTERPADQPPEPAQHRQTRTAAETPLFRFCFCGVCGTNGDQRQF